MMFRLSFLLFLLGLNLSAYSQVVNIENSRIYDDTAGISGRIFGSFSAINNKDLLISTAIRPLIQYKTKMHYYLLIGDWTLSKSFANTGNSTYSNAGMIHFRYAYRLKFLAPKSPKSPWKWESYTQIQYNQLLRQKMRYLFGTGLRLKVYEKGNTRSFAGLSAFYEREEFLDNSYLTDVRLSAYWSWFLNLNNKWILTGTNYYQPRIDDFNDTRFMGQYNLQYRWKSNISFRLDGNIFYNSRPAPTVRTTIYNATLGVQIGLN
ncbi:MAG: hypothetical protein RL264_2591 [Bacteroidota bacterium]|jgi:hypothetical protein